MNLLIVWLKYASPPDNIMSSWMPGDKQNKVVGLGREWISPVCFCLLYGVAGSNRTLPYDFHCKRRK